MRASRLVLGSVLVLVLACASSCASAPATPRASGAAAAEAEVHALLDAWHAAASRADEAAYLGALTADGVFLGTDPSERWTSEEFRAFVQPYFSAGRGWTYVPSDRHVALSADGGTAWIDERLANEKYGELRGTGVLVRTSAGWRIAHYSMSFPVPNDLTLDVVERIRAASAPSSGR